MFCPVLNLCMLQCLRPSDVHYRALKSVAHEDRLLQGRTVIEVQQQLHHIVSASLPLCHSVLLSLFAMYYLSLCLYLCHCQCLCLCLYHYLCHCLSPFSTSVSLCSLSLLSAVFLSASAPFRVVFLSASAPSALCLCSLLSALSHSLPLHFISVSLCTLSLLSHSLPLLVAGPAHLELSISCLCPCLRTRVLCIRPTARHPRIASHSPFPLVRSSLLQG